jgi:hypothetical protein
MRADRMSQMKITFSAKRMNKHPDADDVPAENKGHGSPATESYGEKQRSGENIRA